MAFHGEFEAMAAYTANLQPSVNTILDSVVATTTGSVSGLAPYLNHAAQVVFSIVENATGSLKVQSSLDNTNWMDDYTVTGVNASSSSIVRFSGHRSYLRAMVGVVTGSLTGSVTASVYSIHGA